MIRQITIKGFKSLHDVTVDLGPVTVLVGRSGTGKSNFVDAIRFLRELLIGGSEIQNRLRAPRWIAPNGRKSFAIEFVVHFSIEGIADEFLYELSLTIGEQQRNPSESLRLGAKQLFSLRNGKWDVAPSIQPEPKVEFPMLGRLPSLSEAVIAYSALTSGIGCYEFPYGVLKSKDSNTDRVTGLDDKAANFLGVMKGIYSNLRELNLRKSILAAVVSVNPTVSAIELNDIRKPENALVTHEFGGEKLQFSLAQESEGFRRFLAHLLAIYQDPPKQLLIFEEPENGIYPGALELLASELRSAPELNRGQVLLTTHSPGLLDHFRVDDLRVVTLVDGKTKIGPVTAEQAEGVREGLLSTGELLTVDPARIAESEATPA
ncbi:MAG TPA: AAA family ATPase [Pirellulaceae bacterium]|jgi:predicted ATPase